MDAQKKSALKDHHQELRTGIIVANILPEFRQMLTDVEYSRIEDTTGNVSAVDELVKILLTKTGREFDGFCEILRANRYEHWAKKLEVTAQDQQDPRSSTVGTCMKPEPPRLRTDKSRVTVTLNPSGEEVWDEGERWAHRHIYCHVADSLKTITTQYNALAIYKN